MADIRRPGSVRAMMGYLTAIVDKCLHFDPFRHGE